MFLYFLIIHFIIGFVCFAICHRLYEIERLKNKETEDTPTGLVIVMWPIILLWVIGIFLGNKIHEWYKRS